MAALIILVVTIIVSVVGLSSPRVIERALLRPYQVAHGSGYPGLLTSGFVHAVKYYPAGATTNSEAGVTKLAARYGKAVAISGASPPRPSTRTRRQSATA